MTPKKRRVILIIAIGVILVGAGTIPYQQSVSGPARIEAAVIWYASCPAADQLITGWRRNLLHDTAPQLMMQFTQPDVVEMQFAAGVSEGAIVSAGDTVAWVVSSEGTGQLGVLEAELVHAQRLVDALAAGSRIQDIELAESELNRIRVALDTAHVALKRVTVLHDSGFVSDLELERSCSLVRVLEAGVGVAEANLRAFKAGSRAVDISAGEAYVKKLEREIEYTRGLPGLRRPIITPIGGRMRLADTLEAAMSVERLDTLAAITWLPETAVTTIPRDSHITFNLFADTRKSRRAILHSINFAPPYASGAYIIGMLGNSDGVLRPGMTGEASCPIGKQTFFSGALMKLRGMGFSSYSARPLQ
jgi:hypothetical protein